MDNIESLLSDGETQSECNYCESHVSPKTAKIFGDNEDELYACPSCTTTRDLQRGAGADPSYSNHKI